jgi:hypothetical protein
MLNAKGLVIFDRKILKKKWKRFNKDPLRSAAALTRKIAVRSIRRRKKKTTYSKAGSPPFSKAKGDPFKRILFDRNGPASVVVGMVGFGESPACPGNP